MLSVLIPTHQRPDRLRRCLEALALQTLERDQFEVLVGVDGPEHATDPETRCAADALPGARVLVLPKRGPAAVRNALRREARGEIILLLNDDVIPHADCLREHARAQAERSRGALVLGSAPWVVRLPDRLFDRLIRETSMIFFYDQMEPHRDARERDWGFRHAWTLNLSFRAEDAAGHWFDESLPAPVYEDIEWAWRVTHGRSLPVLYRPSAIVRHDHRYEPEEYLRREQLLGEQAFTLARTSRRCARDIFGRDVTDRDELRYSRLFVERERPLVDRLRDEFFRLADLPAATADAGLIPTLYQQHLLLKRWTWRVGLLAAAERAERRGQETPALAA